MLAEKKKLNMNFHFPFITIDGEDRLLYCSKTARSLLKLSNSVTGDKIETIENLPIFTCEVIEAMQRSLAEGTPYRCEIKKSNMTYLVSIDSNAVEKNVTAVITDITEYRNKEKETALLYHIASTTSSPFTMKEASEKILWQIVNVMNLSGGNIMLINPQTDELIVETTTSINSTKPLRLRRGEGIAGWVAQTGQPLASPHTIFDKKYKMGHKDQDRSLLCVPLATKGQILGVLNLWKSAGEYFAESQVQTFSIIATRIADILDTSRMSVMREERLKLAQILDSTLNLQEMMEQAINKISEILSNSLCSLYVWEEPDQLVGIASSHHNHIEIKKRKIKLNKEKTKDFFEKYGSPTNLENWKSLGWVRTLINKEGWHNATVAALISKGELLGLLFTHNPKHSKFDTEMINLIRSTSSQLAMAIENIQLYNDINKEKNILETIYRTTEEGLLLYGQDGNVLFYNQAAKDLLGLKKDILQEELVSVFERMNIFFKYHFDSPKKYIYCLKKSLNSKQPITMTLTSVKPGKVIKARLEPIKDKKGGEQRLMTLRDLTEIENLNEKLSMRVEQLTDLFRISNLTSAHKTTVDRTVGYLPKLLQAEGSVFLQLAGKGKVDCIASSNWKMPNNFTLDNTVLNNLFKNKYKPIILSGKKLESFNYRVKDIKDILIVPIFSRKELTGLLAVKNKLYHKKFDRDDINLISIVATKISAIRDNLELVNDIKRETARLSTIIDNSADGILAVDKSGKITIWNEAMSNLMGYNKQEMLGEKANELILAGNGHIGLVDLINSSRKKGQRIGSLFEVRLINDKGDVAWVSIHFAIQDNQSGGTEMIIVLNDVSRYKDLEQKKNEFISMTAHELRTPLTAIKGYMSMIINGDAGQLNEKQEKYFARAYNSTERLVSLVEDLLNLIRIEEKRIVFNLQPIELCNLTREVVFDFKQKAKQNAIQLIFRDNISKLHCRAVGDPDRTKQVLGNLIDNALKYSQQGDKVIVRLYFNDKNNQIVTEVKDNGIGIPEGQLESIFEKNYRVKNEISSLAGGYGLGLYITKLLVKEQHGEIWVQSEEGRGSKFSYSLPIVN